ncbi:MAG: hypothetical protein AB1411_11220 [Nitrospirota bacterium]
MRRHNSFSRVAKDNWKFALGLVGLCAVVGLGVSVATGGLEGVVKRATLALRAVENPNQLSAAEKAEVKKMVKDRRSAKEMYDKLSPEEKERAKNTFNALSEEQKKQYRDMFGR